MRLVVIIFHIPLFYHESPPKHVFIFDYLVALPRFSNLTKRVISMLVSSISPPSSSLEPLTEKGAGK
jgi:hypothetical protein